MSYEILPVPEYSTTIVTSDLAGQHTAQPSLSGHLVQPYEWSDNTIYRDDNGEVPEIVATNRCFPDVEVTFPKLHADRKLPFGTLTFFSREERSLCMFGSCGAVLRIQGLENTDVLMIDCWDFEYPSLIPKSAIAPFNDPESGRDVWNLPEQRCFTCLVRAVEKTFNLLREGDMDER